MGDQLPVTARLVRANNPWGMKKTPHGLKFHFISSKALSFHEGLTDKAINEGEAN
ncbi:hypothetical protein ACO11K_003126 [Bacillus cytotoxicus]|uniref:hypothetical protein n=1 Tax=Bacillus cereus group sp. BfR-BA-01492 TaxID=2920361 RepID=UPI001F5644F6|nr:hypothetical protein [Bacillus cereus group sp. BfR-BA-01492]